MFIFPAGDGVCVVFWDKTGGASANPRGKTSFSPAALRSAFMIFS